MRVLDLKQYGKPRFRSLDGYWPWTMFLQPNLPCKLVVRVKLGASRNEMKCIVEAVSFLPHSPSTPSCTRGQEVVGQWSCHCAVSATCQPWSPQLSPSKSCLGKALNLFFSVINHCQCRLRQPQVENECHLPWSSGNACPALYAFG